MENYFASIFKWLVAWKRGLPRTKVSFVCLFPSLALSYTSSHQKEKKTFFDEAVIEGSEAPQGPLRVLYRFHDDRVLFWFLSDRVLLRVHSDIPLFKSPVIFFRVLSNRFFSWLISALFPGLSAIIYQNVLILFY